MVSVYRSVSIATLIRGRQRHFDHLIAGLLAQNFLPDELVVAHMQPDPPAVAGELPFRIRFVPVPMAGDALPLAAARNAAAVAASGDVLAFLDVDCIPDPNFVLRAAEAPSTSRDAVFLPEVHYLPAAPDGWLAPLPAETTPAPAARPDYERLDRSGIRHPAKPDLAGIGTRKVSDHGELWGLAFVMERANWFAAGGMDEDYVGYGGEETDFAQRLREAGIALFWLGGTICYHQHHPVHIPPLHQFDAIVRNARLFHQKWGVWCMDYWLDAFERTGLIARRDDRIAVLRAPSPAEVEAARQGPDVCFS